MWKENLYEPIEILVREHDIFPIGEHQHSFFEMAYILEGTGRFGLNTIGEEKECHTYSAGQLFLIPPNRTHIFTIDSHSKYIFIRFTEGYVSDYFSGHISNIMHLQSGFRIRMQDSDSKAIGQIMHLTASESLHERSLSYAIIQQYVSVIILITARCISESIPEYNNTYNDKAQFMLQYIQQHISQPEMLSLKALGEKFNLSPTYAGRFFRRNFGEEYSQYLMKSRMKKVEEMLVHTKMSIKEIASRMGYIDSCYLNRQFMKNHGITPSQYRKEHSNTDRTL